METFLRSFRFVNILSLQVSVKRQGSQLSTTHPTELMFHDNNVEGNEGWDNVICSYN